ncbi:hypothetical protein K456DRAFT_1602202 [Colletotrichum gloeosporioides 23]|nr:hypothetical protein K456DRAFT_1602202 [Colletotrichum gloeosporioides 23]
MRAGGKVADKRVLIYHFAWWFCAEVWWSSAKRTILHSRRAHVMPFARCSRQRGAGQAPGKTSAGQAGISSASDVV